MESWGVLSVIIGGAVLAIGLAAFLADRRRVRVADAAIAYPLRDLKRERNIAEAVRSGYPCRPILTIEGLICGQCGRGPCHGTDRVTA